MKINLDDLPVGGGVLRAEAIVQHKVLSHDGQLYLVMRRGKDDLNPVAIQFSNADNVLHFLHDILAEAEEIWPAEIARYA